MLKYDFVIYPRKLWIGTKEELKEGFINRDGTEIEVDQEEYDAIVWTIQEKDTKYLGYFVMVDDKITPEITAHEATHVALEVFRDCEIELDLDNQEPLAYLIGFINKCISKYEIN